MKNIQFQFLIDAIPNPVAIFDEIGNILLVNQEWLQFGQQNGAQKEKICPGTNYLSVTKKAELEGDQYARSFLDRFSNIVNGKSVEFSLEYPCHSPQEQRWFDLHLQKIENDGSPRYLLLHREITEDINRKSLLKQSLKMEAVGQLSTGIAHDFNNILAAALGNLELIKDFNDAEKLEKRFAGIKRAILRGSELTQRLLAFSRKQALEPIICDVGDIIYGMEILLKRTIPESINMIWNIDHDLWPVKIDQAQLENALLNLVINARDAMSDGGTLVISCSNNIINLNHLTGNAEITPDDYVIISVEDTGTGIDKTDLKKVFEPFFTTKGVGQGSGLGLSMVYGFVSQSGGYVDIISEPNIGTKFFIYLPRDRSEEMLVDLESSEAETNPPKGNGETILVIEDEPEVREVTIQLLRHLNYNCIDGGDGHVALENCNGSSCKFKKENCVYERSFDLILFDVVLPNGTSGPALVDNLTKCDPKLKCLLMTGYAGNETLFSEGGDLKYPILDKPFTRHQLASAVHAQLSCPH